MKGKYQYKVKKKLHHIFMLLLIAIVILLIVNIISAPLLFIVEPLYAGYFLGIVVLIVLIFTLLYFPMTVNLTNKIKVKYVIGREKEIDFPDIKYYEINTYLTKFSIIKPSIIDLKLVNGRKISFFFDKEDYDYIENYFKNHKIKKYSIAK